MITYTSQRPETSFKESSRFLALSRLHANVHTLVRGMRDRITAERDSSAASTRKAQSMSGRAAQTRHNLDGTYLRIRVCRNALARVWSSPCTTKVAHDPSSLAFCSRHGNPASVPQVMYYPNPNHNCVRTTATFGLSSSAMAV